MNTNNFNFMREIWGYNYMEEMRLMMECVPFCHFIAIDTEFPGCLRNTPMNAPDSVRYTDMKFTVDNTKLIQFGFTLFDSHCRIWGSWQVNLSGFRETVDPRNDESVAFLKRSGLDLEKINNYGVCIDCFFYDFFQILSFQRDLSWITFHGNIDFGYLVKMFTQSPLPHDQEGFAEIAGWTLGRVYDIKAMAGRFNGLTDRLGLQRLASELGVARTGSAHHAGSDSLLTAQTFIRMVARCRDLSEFEGSVYGLGARVVSRRGVL